MPKTGWQQHVRGSTDSIASLPSASTGRPTRLRPGWRGAFVLNLLDHSSPLTFTLAVRLRLWWGTLALRRVGLPVVHRIVILLLGGIRLSSLVVILLLLSGLSARSPPALVLALLERCLADGTKLGLVRARPVPFARRADVTTPAIICEAVVV